MISKSRNKYTRALALVITVLWLVLMATLLQKHYWGGAPAPVPSGAPPQWALKEHWMGIYRGQSKIGYASTSLSPREGGYTGTEFVLMRIRVLGVQKEIRSTTEAALGPDFRLRSFKFSLLSDSVIKAEGKVVGDELIISIDMGGSKTTKRLRLSEMPYMGLALTPLLKGLTPGTKISVPMIEPSSFSAEEAEFEALGRETITVMGVGREAIKLRGSFMGVEMLAWVTGEGEILRQEAMGLTFVMEAEETALKIGGASLDLIADLAIQVEPALPGDLSFLKVRLEGADLRGLELTGGLQSAEGNVVEIRRAKLPLAASPARPLSAEALKSALAQTAFIQSEDPAIVALADSITAGAEEPAERARLIHEWVYANIQKTPTMTLPSALEVLGSRRGDCNEHTTLFTALARAAGVPTRIAVGLVHLDGAFYYHAWPEVYLSGWVPIDPTLGQYPADATHIRLLTGGIEQQLRLGTVFGKLKIKALEYR